MKLVLQTLLTLLAITAGAQTPAGLISFNAYSPETVTQGNSIEVKYILEATNLKINQYPEVSGGRIVDSDISTVTVDNKYHRSTIRFIIEALCCGRLLVDPMTAIVDGETVRSSSVAVDVSPNPQYGKEWITARDYLYTLCGYTGNDLEFKYGYTTLMAFSDEKAKVFGVVVSEEYQPYMADAILAYGEGNPMWNGEDNAKDNSIYAILSRYDAQLKLLKRRNEVYHALQPASYDPNPDGAGPLLDGIEYGQSGTYNLYFPEEQYNGKTVNCLAGCGPVALAQVLSMYRFPAQPSGSNIFTVKSGKRYKDDLGKYGINWNNMQKKDTAALLYCAAVSVGADMGPTGTSSALANFKSALICNWDYSPQCMFVKEHFDFSMLAMIYEEIDNGRPVIVADDSHLFVCDGYYRDFLHFNLGWNGYCNGYYRALVIPSAAERQLPFKEMLVGIRPDSSGRVSKTVHLEEAGTLASLLSDAEKRNVTDLAIQGPINGEDIKLLRQMAGAIYLNWYSEWYGSLMNLDLRNAEIEDGDEYLTESADGYRLSGTVYNNGIKTSYSYDFSNMTDGQWEEIVSIGANELDSQIFRRGSDGNYYVTYLTENGAIGDKMFSDCQNLRSVILPKWGTKVGRHAFFNCRSLQSVRLNGTSGDVSQDAFEFCERLTEVQ